MDKPAAKKPRIRSQNPERIRTPNLSALVELLVLMSEDELRIGRNLMTHELAQRLEFCDDPELQADLDWVNGIIAIDEANLRCLEETGVRLRTMHDYKSFKADDAPSGPALARLFASWPEALATAGVLALAQPEAELTKRPGGPRPKGSHKWTYEECVHAVALLVEKFQGRRFSSGIFNQSAAALNRPMPTYEDIRKAVTGISGKSQGAWDEVRAAAYDYIRQNPGDFPHAFDYLSRRGALS